MKNSKLIGIFCAAAAAITYGMNPFFGLPLYAEGLTPFSVLFYRFFFAAILMGIVTVLRKAPFTLQLKYLWQTLLAGALMAMTCIFWFLAFQIMDSGISAALLFIYPVMVALIMVCFFKEKLSFITIFGIAAALAGVTIICLPGSGGEARINFTGITYIMLSALAYAIYIVAVRTTKLRELAPETLTFYAMIFSLPFFLMPLRGGVDLQALPSWQAFFNAMGLALFPSLLSFLFAAIAINRIGATQTAIFGALEPVTAVAIGILRFGETMTWKLAIGTVIILAAVCAVICSNNKSTSKQQFSNTEQI